MTWPVRRDFAVVHALNNPANDTLTAWISVRISPFILSRYPNSPILISVVVRHWILKYLKKSVPTIRPEREFRKWRYNLYTRQRLCLSISFSRMIYDHFLMTYRMRFYIAADKDGVNRYSEIWISRVTRFQGYSSDIHRSCTESFILIWKTTMKYIGGTFGNVFCDFVVLTPASPKISRGDLTSALARVVRNMRFLSFLSFLRGSQEEGAETTIRRGDRLHVYHSECDKT